MDPPPPAFALHAATLNPPTLLRMTRVESVEAGCVRLSVRCAIDLSTPLRILRAPPSPLHDLHPLENVLLLGSPRMLAAVITQVAATAATLSTPLPFLSPLKTPLHPTPALSAVVPTLPIFPP